MPVKDISGQVFGRLTVISYAGGGNWLCRCSCGTEKTIYRGSLTQGLTLSCGCFKVERTKQVMTTHGETVNGPSREYRTWQGIQQRCYNPDAQNFKYYGARGIKVCQRWLESFENFLVDMGRCPPSLTLERNDNDGNYEPSNCRWATWSEQNRNKRRVA